MLDGAKRLYERTVMGIAFGGEIGVRFGNHFRVRGTKGSNIFFFLNDNNVSVVEAFRLLLFFKVLFII